MAQWDDYSGDDWMRPSSSQETQKSKNDGAHATRGHAQRPRLKNSPWKIGQIVAGFELLRAIDCGSHGWVYEARETETGKTVALKLIPTIDPADAVRSKTGFRRMCKLRHPGLVRLYRILQDDDALAFSMELIEGDNLVQVLRRWKSLPLHESCERLLEMLRQVGAGLNWIHAQQLVHRDIKPTNLMMTNDGNRFVIVDCDLAGEFEAESDPQNIRSYLIWTPMYVAPEVLFRQSYCPASDIFSLGMVALEALRMFSSAQRRRDRDALENSPIHPGDAATTDHEDDMIPRDERSSQSDREYIISAMVGLHSDIPECLLECVHEMLSPEVPDRPTAMAVSRVGRESTPLVAISTQSHASTRAERITKVARAEQLIEFRRWCHLILGGQVKRLHVDGTSGIGKSTFLQLAIDELRSQSWPLVFVARCQRFEQIPLQAFSQIADEIVIRYRRGGFEKIKVDSVSESILQRVLPGLGEILEVDWSQPPIVTSDKRTGGLEAAIKVCNQLREVGPVFFVIDDVQWADRDTLRTLDHFQSSASSRMGPPLYQGLGLITVSRAGGDRQQFPPDANITIEPLTSEVTSQAIRSEAKLQGIELDDARLEALNEQIEGQPYRLEAYLSELSPSGLLHDCLTRKPQASSHNHSAITSQLDAPSIEDVWQHRSDQLSPSVKALLNIIVVAGRQITFDQLCSIENNSALLETQLDELVENRLIVRDGFNEQFIRVWHDRLAIQLRSAIPTEQRQRLHRLWAECLVNVPLSAGRIAEHYEQGGDIPEFVKWANQAAMQAQQVYAHLEAARWHRSVASYSSGVDRIDALRSSAESLQRSGRLYEAAQTYQELAELLSGQAKLDTELEQVQCFIRSGRFAHAVDRLDPLLARLKLPRRKQAWATKLSIAWQLTRQAIFTSARDLDDSYAPPQRSELLGNQIAVCGALVRPLSMLDNWLAAELNVFNRGLVRQFGSRGEQIELIIGTCVFDSYRPGRKRIAAAHTLSHLQETLSENDPPGYHGDVQCGLAWANGMSGQFQQATQHILQARKCYADSELHHGFELAHTSCLEAACYFQMGNLTALADMVEDMQAEGATMNDCFVLAMGSLGYSSVAFLMRNDMESLRDRNSQLLPSLQDIGEDAFGMGMQFESLLRAIYQNQPRQTERVLAQIAQQCDRSVLYRNQLMKTLIAELSAIATLSLLSHPSSQTKKNFRNLIKLLRRQRLDAADLKANLIEGIAMARYPEVFSGDRGQILEQAKTRLTRAAESAAAQQLTPHALAAQDELALLAGDTAPSHLDVFLTNQGVVSVTDFARLYRGARN